MSLKSTRGMPKGCLPYHELFFSRRKQPRDSLLMEVVGAARLGGPGGQEGLGPAEVPAGDMWTCWWVVKEPSHLWTVVKMGAGGG
jgi:hypothetical protein